MRRFYFLVPIFSLLFIANTKCQEVWSLERCVQHAIQNNLTIQQAKLNVQLAEIEQKTAKHAIFPSLNAASDLGVNFGKTIDPTSNSFITESFTSNRLSLNAFAMLYNGGRNYNAIKQSNYNIKAASLDAEQSEKDISLFVSSAYLNVLFAKDNIKIAQNQISLTQEQYDNLKKLVDAGASPSSELLAIEAQMANDNQSLIQAQNTYQTTLLNLKQLLRFDDNVEMEVAVPTNEITLAIDPDVVTFDEVYTSALNVMSNIKASEYRVKSANLDDDIAKSALLPSLSVGASLGSNYSNLGLNVDGVETEIENQELIIAGFPVNVGFPVTRPITSKASYFDQLDNNLSYGFGVNLNIPIYNNYRNKGGVEIAKIGIENAVIADEQLKENLKTTVLQSLADARAAKKTLNAADKSLEAQRTAFENAKKRYDAGALNGYDYINARSLMDNAELNRLMAKYDYIFKVKVLEFYLGKPLQING